MVALLEKTENGYAIPLTMEMVEAMQLREGSPVEVSPVGNTADAPHTAIRYATVQEALRAFEETLPQHEAAYRELAK